MLLFMSCGGDNDSTDVTDEEEPIEYTALYNKIKSKNMKKD